MPWSFSFTTKRENILLPGQHDHGITFLELGDMTEERNIVLNRLFNFKVLILMVLNIWPTECFWLLGWQSQFAIGPDWSISTTVWWIAIRFLTFMVPIGWTLLTLLIFVASNATMRLTFVILYELFQLDGLLVLTLVIQRLFITHHQ